jgi:hypothetical protein
MADVNKVTSAKPKIGGAIYSAPLGTTLPTDATTELNTAFKALGYISEDGLVNENTASTENLKAWGGDIVDVVQTEKTDKFTYTLIESLNIDVLKEIYGKDNVEGDLETGITIKANTKELEHHSVVIEMILKGGVLKRIVIPNGKVGEVGEIKYTDSEMVGFETTLNAFPDSKANTHYEYIKKNNV